MNGPQDDRSDRNFLSGVLLAGGAMICGLSGLCTMSVMGAEFAHQGFALFRDTSYIWFAVVGGAPFLFGLLVIAVGLRLRRR